MDRYHGVEGGDLADELAVPLSGSPGAMDHDHVGVVGKGVNNGTRLGPLAGSVGVRLVLHYLGSEVEPLLHPGMPLGVQLLPQVSLDPPLLPGLVPGLQGREVVPQGATKQYHGWAETS